MPLLITYAENEPNKFVTSANANHWGRSDLRAYLNGVEKTDNTLPIDTTKHEHQTSDYYESQFSAEEYAIIEPWTYSTNILDKNSSITATYETTDKFILPSGNITSDQVISWGNEDLSADSQYIKSIENDKNRIIPISYWAKNNSQYTWLRSSSICNYNALTAYSGRYISEDSVNNIQASGVVPIFKIDLSSVLFASAVSITTEGGAQKIEISGSNNFGKRTDSPLPDYGMYLKTKYKSLFQVNQLILSGSKLKVNFSNGEADKHIVVQAFKDDNLEDGTTSYSAIMPIHSGSTSCEIDVSNWESPNLKGYSIKVWMEDNFDNLSRATEPETFIVNESSIEKTTDTAPTNSRVFAMKEDLQCSWGVLNSATDLVGLNPTNQKIYYGKDKNGEPLQFWIAGRENEDGQITSDGNIMCLYQGKMVEARQFNKNINNYISKSDVTLELEDNIQVWQFFNSKVSYPKVSYLSDNISDFDNINWQYRLTGNSAWIDGIPRSNGNYEVRAYVKGTENHERTYSAVVNFNVKQVPLYIIIPVISFIILFLLVSFFKLQKIKI